MQSLRRAHFIARLVLAWFALSIGAAVASPMISPQGIELICSGSGAMKLLVKGDDSSTTTGSHTLECPLCATLAAPPPAAPAQGQAPKVHSRALQTGPCARPAAISAAPPPGRGPPRLLLI